MKLDVVKSTLREVWYLVALLAAVMAAALYVFLTQTPAFRGEELLVSPAATEAKGQDETAATPEPRALRPTEQDKAREVIAAHQERLDEDPKDPDAPALLNAMANLSRQKLEDYKEAAQYYELLIADYPDWEGIAKVYPQLATCYERLGDVKSMQDVYRRMMQKFPPDSQEYLYAESELGL